jgi:hypothetical protein
MWLLLFVLFCLWLRYKLIVWEATPTHWEGQTAEQDAKTRWRWTWFWLGLMVWCAGWVVYSGWDVRPWW